MELRRLVRGRVAWPRLEAVVRELAERYGHDELHVRFMDADNWLSTPMIVDDRWFVKAITRQNSLVHALFTTGRNLGAFSSGTEGFFEHFGTPYEMAEHELRATEEMRRIGLNAPEPVEAFESNGLGVVVLEYLPEFEPLDDLDAARARRLAPDLFRSLRTLHDNGLAHGDLRAENVLVVGDDLHFIDATNVRERGRESARAYDLACGLAALEPLVGARTAVGAALAAYDAAELLRAEAFLDFVSIRPDHEFEVTALKSEIGRRVENDPPVTTGRRDSGTI